MAQNDSKPPRADLLTIGEVLSLGAGRWKSSRTLAASSRRKGGPAGRVTLGPTRAAYRRADFLAWLAAEEVRTYARLESQRASAARAREILAEKRAARRVGGDA